MITLQEPELQFLIPRWLEYRDALPSGELFLPDCCKIISTANFESEFSLFKQYPTPLLAGDLLGKAFFESRSEAGDLARYLLTNPNTREPTKRLARRILGIGEISVPQTMDYSKKISALKDELRIFPKNPVRWIDLARLYTIVSQKASAERALRIALALAPEDRFCIRAAARFYFHYHDYPAADDLFRGKQLRLRDPWLLATAASAAALANKPSPLPRKLLLDITSPRCYFRTPNYSKHLECTNG